MSDRALWLCLAAGGVLSIAVCLAVASKSLILGVPDAGWFYGYAGHFTRRPIGAALLVTGVCSALLLYLPSDSRRHWPLVIIWILAATALHGLLRSLTPVTLEEIFVSDGANSFYSVTQRFSARDILSSFEQVRARSPLHAQSNMPGKLMFLHGLQAIARDPAALAWLVVLASNLGAALTYLVARDLFDDRGVAFFSMILYLFVPARLLFFPLMNTVTPVVALSCAWLLLRWLRTGATQYAVLLGAALYVLVFFEPLPLVLGLLFAALVARTVASGSRSWRSLLPQIGWGFVAFATTYAAMYLWFGFDLVSAFRQVGAHATEFNASAGRPYGVWIRENLREFGFGVGICQAVVFVAALAEALRTPGSWRTRLATPIATLCVSLVAVLVATDLIGINRGEVVRLWIFLACFFQIPAAYVCARLRSRGAVLLIVGTSALQVALGTSMIGFVLVE